MLSIMNSVVDAYNIHDSIFTDIVTFTLKYSIIFCVLVTRFNESSLYQQQDKFCGTNPGLSWKEDHVEVFEKAQTEL